MNHRIFHPPWILCALLIPVPAWSQAPRDPTYWQDVRPILRRHCTVCHQARHIKKIDVSGGLALDTIEAIRKGGEKLVLHPGKGAESSLYQLLITPNEAKRMPLDAPPLDKDKIALLKRWIDTGAREGTKPVATTPQTPPPTPTKAVTRKLDIPLATGAVPPRDLLAKGAPAKLELRLKAGPLAPVVAVAFSPDGKLLASGSYGQVTLWDLATGEVVKVLTNVLGAVNDLRFSPDGTLLAVAGGQPSARGDLRLFQVKDWKLLHTMRGHDDVIFTSAFRPDGKAIATASFDKTVRVWDTATGQLLAHHGGHSDFVHGVAFSPDGQHLVSCSRDRTVKLIEAASGKSVFTFSGMEQDVMAVAYSPDGKHIVSSGFEAGIYWWNPKTGERTRLQGGHGIAVNELGFSKDGKRLVSAGSDRTARVWDGTAGNVLKVLAVGSPVYAVALSPNGKKIATGSFDGLVRLWDEASGRQLLTLVSLPANGDKADWLALTPEGYARHSLGLTTVGRWRMANQEVAADRVWPALHQPDRVARALRGESVPLPTFEK